MIGEFQFLSRNVKLFLAAASVVVAVALVFVVLAQALRSGQQRSERNREGRAVAVAVTCAAIKSLVEGGVRILAAGAALPGDRALGDPLAEDFKVISGEQSSFLEAHGLPGPQERVARARRVALAYRVDTTAGIVVASGVALAQTNGEIDCRKLRSATGTVVK